MADITGVIRSDKTESYRQKTDIKETIFDQVKDRARFYYLMRKLRKRKAEHWQFYHQERAYKERGVVISAAGGCASAGTSITLTGNSTRLFHQQVLWNMTDGDWTIVDAVNTSTHVVTIKATNKAWSNDAVLVGGGQAIPEGGTMQDAWFKELTNPYNYCEQKVRTVPISWREKKAKKYGPDELALRRQEAFFDLCEDVELMLLFGHRGSVAESDGAVTTVSGGLDTMITTNSLDCTSLTEPDLIAEMKDLAVNGVQNWMLLDGGNVIEAIEGWKLADRWVKNEEVSDILSTDVMRWRSSFGSITFLHLPTLAKYRSTKAFLVPMDNLGYYEYQPWAHLTDLADPKDTQDCEGFFVDCGLGIEGEIQMDVFTNTDSI